MQWRSSSPKSGGGGAQTFFPENWKAKKKKKKKKKVTAALSAWHGIVNRGRGFINLMHLLLNYNVLG